MSKNYKVKIVRPINQDAYWVTFFWYPDGGGQYFAEVNGGQLVWISFDKFEVTKPTFTFAGIHDGLVDAIIAGLEPVAHIWETAEVG